MKCFVTGGSGFIGANLVHELNRRGHEVRCLLRPGTDLTGLRGAEFKTVPGDLSDTFRLRREMAGCDWCFHLAASYHLWLPDYRPMYRTSVAGTRAVLEAAVAAGCRRIVHTSTVGCMGLAPDDQPGDEDTPVSAADIDNHYKRSKWPGEQVAREFARNGAPVVIVNPSAPVGPRDRRPTPTGQIVLDHLNRRMPAYLDTGLNWVHVADVAAGHVLAAERGRIGERYVLGNDAGNLSLKDAFSLLAEITGLPAPRLRLPFAAAWLAGAVNEAFAKLADRPPRVPLAGVRMARHMMYFRCRKAVTELGLPQTPVSQALAEAVAWFRKHPPRPPQT